VFDTSEADTEIRVNIDHRPLHRMVWVASDWPVCESGSASDLIGFDHRFGRRPSGRLFRFQLDHGPIGRSIGCPVFRVAMEAEATELRGQSTRQLAGNYAATNRSMVVFQGFLRLELRGRFQEKDRETRDFEGKELLPSPMRGPR
jgi:hypothetical protein